LRSARLQLERARGAAETLALALALALVDTIATPRE